MENLKKFYKKNSNELTIKEIEVLNLLYEGKTNKEIAEVLFLSTDAIRSRLKSIYEKLKARNRMEAVVKASQSRLLNKIF